MVKKVPSVLHGEMVEGDESPPFTLYYESGLPYRLIKEVLIPKKGYFGKIKSTRPITPPAIKLQNGKLMYDTLQEDILKRGFRNPILCWNLNEGLYCIYGTTRLYIATKIRRDIPAFILDFAGTFPGEERVTREEQALSKFQDEPETFVYRDDYFNFVNERWYADPLVRKANNLPQNRLTNAEVASTPAE